MAGRFSAANGWLSVGLMAFGFVASVSAQGETSKLGLGERRAIKQYQEGAYPALLKSIQDAAGFEVPLEVQWEAIAVPGQAEHYGEDSYWTQIFFQPLAAALGQITADQMGKDALKNGLKKIVITYDASTAPASNYPNGLTFEGGVLTINFAPGTNAGDETTYDFKERVKAIVGALEPKL